MTELMNDVVAQPIRDGNLTVELQHDVAVQNANKRECVPALPASKVAMFPRSVNEHILNQGLTAAEVTHSNAASRILPRREIES